MIFRRVSRQEYGLVAKTLHWSIVGLLIAQFTIAWSMPDIGPRTHPDRLINLHLSFGALILLVVLLRLVWRILNPVELLPGMSPRWQQTAARIMHFALYLLAITIPLLGWASASGRGFAVSFFGLISLPHILPARSRLTSVLGDIHTVESYVLLGLVGLHVMAALYHHFIVRDDTLRRMFPSFR